MKPRAELKGRGFTTVPNIVFWGERRFYNKYSHLVSFGLEVSAQNWYDMVQVRKTFLEKRFLLYEDNRYLWNPAISMDIFGVEFADCIAESIRFSAT